MDEQASEREESETNNREYKTKITPVEAVKHHEYLSTNVTVQDKTAKGDIKDDTPTSYEKVNSSTHTGDLRARKLPIEEVLRTLQSIKRDAKFV